MRSRPAQKATPRREGFETFARLPWTVSLMIAASEWQQEMVEGPVCHASALGTRREVREPEVNPQQDTRVDDVPRGVRVAVVPADLLHRQWRGTLDFEEHSVRAEEQLEDARHRAGHAIRARGVVRIVRIIDQWLPRRVAQGRRIAVGVALA